MRTSTVIVKNLINSNIATQKRDELIAAQQASSGKRNQEYTDVLDLTTVRHYVDSENEIYRLENKISTNNLLEAKIGEMSKAITDLQPVLNEAMVLRLQASSPVSMGSVPVGEMAKILMGRVQNILNSQYNGQYLFAGSNIETIPVQNLDSVDNIVSGAASANYYHGNGVILSQNLTDNSSIKYGITADNPAFQNLIAGLNSLINGYNSGDDLTIYDEADVFFQNAKSQLNSLTSLVGVNQRRVEAQASGDKINLVNKNANFELIDNIDRGEAWSKLINIKHALESSYAATKEILNMNFAKYL